MVIFDGVGADREEGAEADVEGEVFDLDAAGFEAGEDFFGHVEAGGWGGGGSGFVGEYGLVALVVGLVGVAIHVGREGDFAELVGEIKEVRFAGDDGEAVAEDLVDSEDMFVSRAEEKLSAGAEAAAVHAFVATIIVLGVALEDDDFASGAFCGFCVEAGFDDFCVVEDEEVTGVEKVGEVGVVFVENFAGDFIEHEQTGGATDFWRVVRD